MIVCTVTLGTMLALMGCGGLARDRLVLHPKTPILVSNELFGWVEVCVYDPEEKKTIVYSWWPASRLVGWGATRDMWSYVTDENND